jgi:hypothetical protein
LHEVNIFLVFSDLICAENIKVTFYNKDTKRKLKRKTLLQEQEHKRKHKKNKNTMLRPVKRFLYSHIASLHTLFVGAMMLYE